MPTYVDGTDSATMCAIRAEDKKLEMEMPGADEPMVAESPAKMPKLELAYPDNSAAMLFMCSPGIRPARNPTTVPARALTHRIARSEGSITL